MIDVPMWFLGPLIMWVVVIGPALCCYLTIKRVGEWNRREDFKSFTTPPAAPGGME